MLGFYTTK